MESENQLTEAVQTLMMPENVIDETVSDDRKALNDFRVVADDSRKVKCQILLLNRY